MANQNVKLLHDLMTKLSDDSTGAIKRTVDLFTTAVPQRDRETFVPGAINIVRAGLTPYLRELLSIAAPEMVAASLLMQIIYIKRISNGKIDMFTEAEISATVTEFVELLTPLLKKEIEK